MPYIWLLLLFIWLLLLLLLPVPLLARLRSAYPRSLPPPPPPGRLLDRSMSSKAEEDTNLALISHSALMDL